MRVLTVVGARPQFVKAAPVSRALRPRAEEILLHTGQHTDDAMSAAFFRGLSLPEPDLRLDVTDLPPGRRLAAMVRGIGAAIRERRPDRVLVYGDTDSTLAGALAAAEARVPLAHVEAGLRSGDRTMPEEANRIATDHLADLLLAPTAHAAGALRRERTAGRIEVVGDVMLDACLAAAPSARALGMPARFGVPAQGYHVVTVHRAANADSAERIAQIVRALDALELPVLFPCHPRTRAALARLGLDGGLARLRVVDPLPYAEMLGLVADARVVLTDSGGLQKEAMFLAVPCVTLRDETEWVDTISAGWNRLAGTDPGRIRAAIAAAVRPAAPPDLAAWGGGRAAERIAASLLGG